MKFENILMSKLSSLFPIVDTLNQYEKKDFRADLYAGLTVGVLLIPQSMAYAMLAGVPPIYGLYASLIPLIVYAIMGSSPHLSMGPSALTSILVVSGIGPMAVAGSDLYIYLVIATSLMVGLLQVAMGALKLGFFVNFISHPVVAGFTSAAAIIIIVTQLPDILGVEIPRLPQIYDTLIYAVKNIYQVHWITLVIFASSTAAILLIKRLHRFLPSGLIVMVAAILLSWLFKWDQLGVSIIGPIPAGIPSIVWPVVSIGQMIELMPTVFTLLTIGIVSSMSIARAIEAKHHYYEVRPDQELIGMGMAKVVGSFFQAIPTDGSFSRSTICSDTGGRTSMSSVFAAGLVAISLLLLTTLLYYLPLAVLSAVIVVAVVGLIELDQAIYLWKTHRTDFIMMVITFGVTLTVGVMEGVVWGVLLSIFNILYRSTHPSVVELGRIEGTTRYRNLARYEEAIKREDIAVVRFDEQLYFANAPFFKESIRKCVNHHDSNKLRTLIIDASNIHSIDSTGIRVIREVEIELARKGIVLHLSNVIGPVRDILYKCDLLNEPDKHHMSVHEAVQSISKSHKTPQVDYSKGAMQTNVVREHPPKKKI